MTPIGYTPKCRGRDGERYNFEVEETPTTFRIYIVRQPSYRGRDTSLHATHRLMEDGRYYICWAGNIRSSSHVHGVIKLWVHLTEKYIRTGARF